MFQFDPVSGMLDIDIFPTDPGSETAARQQFMTLFNQLKDYLNTDLSHTGTIASEGSIVLPLGLILKWGNAYVSNGSTGEKEVTVTFTNPFPNACFIVNGSLIEGDTEYHHNEFTSLKPWTKTAFTFRVRQDNAAYGASFAWFAIGN